jgi:hypothetical protein
VLVDAALQRLAHVDGARTDATVERHVADRAPR